MDNITGHATGVNWADYTLAKLRTSTSRELSNTQYTQSPIIFKNSETSSDNELDSKALNIDNTVESA